MLKMQPGRLGGDSAQTRSRLWTKPATISRLQQASLLKTGNGDVMRRKLLDRARMSNLLAYFNAFLICLIYCFVSSKRQIGGSVFTCMNV